MSYKYPREAPKWTQATSVQAATPDGSYVNVQFHSLEFRLCRVGWHNPFMNKAKADVDVETEEWGWLRLEFNLADVQPYQEANDASTT